MSDWKRDLEGLRESLPNGPSGNEGPFGDSQKKPEEEPLGEVTPDVEVPTRSLLYILYAANYDLDPMIRKLYPEGKQQYLNAMLRSLEAGQNQWPESVTSREQALAPYSDEEIRSWFESSGRPFLEQLGYPDSNAYLREILQETSPAPVEAAPEVLYRADEAAAEQSGGLISDPDAQQSFFHSRSMLRDDALRSRLVKKRAPNSTPPVTTGRTSRENQADFDGSKGMRGQEEGSQATGLIVNTGTHPREGAPQEGAERGAKFNTKLGTFVHPDYSAKNYHPPDSTKLEVPPGTEEWLRSKESGTDSGFRLSGEASERVGEIKFDWSLIDRGGDSIFLSFVGKVEDGATGRLKPSERKLAFNLPKEAVVAARGGERLAIEQAAKECVLKNQGSPFVQVIYNRSSGNVFFGLGKKDLPEIGKEISIGELRSIAGERAEEVTTYIDRKSREFKTLDYETEKGPMRGFEIFLLAQRVDNDKLPGVKGKKLSQVVWDEAFRQIWEKEVGPEKLAQLRAQAEQMPAVIMHASQPRTSDRRPAVEVTRNPEKNRWIVSPDVGRQADIAVPKNKFFGLIREEFGTDYRKFLEAGKFREFANEAEISPSEAINLAAEKILLESGRDADYQELQRFAEWPRDKQAKFLVDNGLRVGGEHNFGLLFKRLYLFVSGGEVEQADSSNAGEGQMKRHGARVAATVRRESFRPSERKESSTGIDDRELADIMQWAEEEASNAPYNPNYDPTNKIGLI
jgi:hypothetical protein